MTAAMRPEWGPHVYVPYEALKRTLASLAHAETAAQVCSGLGTGLGLGSR